MTPILHTNKCDSCGRSFKENEEIVALIPHVIVTNGRPDNKVRLKLSPKAIDSRALKIYCEDCLRLNEFILNV